MFIRDPNFFHPGSRVKKIPGSLIRIRIRIKEFKYFNLKNCSTLSEIRSKLFMPDTDLDFLPIPDPGGKKGTGSRIRNTVSYRIFCPFNFTSSHNSDRLDDSFPLTVLTPVTSTRSLPSMLPVSSTQAFTAASRLVVFKFTKTKVRGGPPPVPTLLRIVRTMEAWP